MPSLIMEVSENTPKKVDKNILDLFWKLSDNNQKSRIGASVKILRYMISKQNEADNPNEMCTSVQYCVERLVKGLASSRDSARLGFSLLLIEILKRINVVQVDDVLEYMKKHLSPAQKLEKDIIFGQLFAYASIVRSSRLTHDNHLSSVILQLFNLWQGRGFIMNASYEILLNIFLNVPLQEFQEHLWPILKKKMAISSEKSSADTLWPLFLCMRLYPTAVPQKFIKKHWNSSHILAAENFDHLKRIMKQTSACLPNLHPLCVEFLFILKGREDMKVIWNAIVDENLLESELTEKTYVVFEMVKKVIQDIEKKKMLKCVLSTKFCIAFTRSLLSSKHAMHPAASILATSLREFVKKNHDPDRQVIVLKIFLDSLHAVSPEQIFNNADFTAIVQSLRCDAVKKYCELLKSIVLSQEVESDNENDFTGSGRRKRLQAVLQIGSLISHPEVIADKEWRLSIVQFLYLHSFFRVEAPTQDILHCEAECAEVSADLRNAFQNSFYKSMNCLHQKTAQNVSAGGQYEQFLDLMLSMVQYADQLISYTDFVSPQFPLEKVQASWDHMKTSVRKLSKQSEKDGRTVESNAFQTLFLALGFHLFSDPDNISELFSELHICCKKALRSRKHNDEDSANDGEPSWVAVVTDILLSLLSKNSHHLRCIVSFVFPLLSSFITEESLQQILTVINPEKNDEEPMLVDEAGEESDAEFDSGSSSEEDEELDEKETTHSKMDEEFRKRVKEALGPAADESDAESVVLSDSEMFKLDDAISKAFQSRVQSGHTQINEEDKTMLHFRVRCLDLISIYLKSEPPMKMVLLCIPPLVAAYEYGGRNKHLTQLLQKSMNTLQVLTKIKKFQNTDDVEKSQLKELLESLIARCHKETDMLIAKKLYSLCVFLVLCFRRLEANKTPEKKSKKTPLYMKLYFGALESFVKTSNMYPQFFVTLMETCPDLALDFINPCKNFAFDKEMRPYKRTQCLGIISEAVKHSKSQINISSETWLEIGEDIIPSAIENLKEVLSSAGVKPAYLTELLFIVHSISMIIKEKTNKCLLSRHPELLPLLKDMEKAHVYKLTKKAKNTRRKLIIALGGSRT